MFIKASEFKDGDVFYYIQCIRSVHSMRVLGQVPKQTLGEPPYNVIQCARLVGVTSVDGKVLRFNACDVDDEKREHVYPWEVPLSAGFLEYHWPTREAAQGMFNIMAAEIDSGIRYGETKGREDGHTVKWDELASKDVVYSLDLHGIKVEAWKHLDGPFWPSHEDKQAMALYQLHPKKEGDAVSTATRKNFKIEKDGTLKNVFRYRDVAERHLQTVRNFIEAGQSESQQA